MNPAEANALYGTTFDCVCGRTHSIEPHRVLYAPEADRRLPEILAEAVDGRRVGLVMDRRTRMIAGDEAGQAFEAAGWDAWVTIVPDPRCCGGTPSCDDQTFATLQKSVPELDALVAVGSGVLNDLAKWLACERGIPYACLATAASMNGYASANVAPTVEGVKTLVHARAPYAVAADPHVIANAPARLTASGLGDILAKSVSSADWKLNQLLFGDYFCERAVALIAELEPLYMDNPAAVKSGESGAIEALFQGLLLTGVAMTMAESSAPASGAEHLVSHTLDMMDSLDGAGHDLHGRQVGVGTILAAALYEEVLAVERPEPVLPPAAVDDAFWGRLTPEVERHYAEKRGRLATAADLIQKPQTWDRVRTELATILRPAARIRDCLREAGAAHRAEEIGCSPERLARALQRASQMRSRFTVLDLAMMLDILPGRAGEFVQTWAG
jgi:glycerol-1-phosphate dehydrogenase [NAD(P)+]